MMVYDRKDLLDGLRKRRPTRESKLVDTPLRNLLPKCRRSMSDKMVNSLSVMEEYGR